MGLFDFFKKNQQPQTINVADNNIQPDIPKDLFIEELDQEGTSEQLFGNENVKGINSIYAFLQGDYESKGYNDALTNSDDSYKADNVKLIRLDLQILIQKVYTYYQDIRTELDSHIITRGRAGLMDLVQDLETRKLMVEEHVNKVKQIEVEIHDENGMANRIILSYQRGFMRGLSALTQSQLLNKKL